MAVPHTPPVPRRLDSNGSGFLEARGFVRPRGVVAMKKQWARGRVTSWGLASKMLSDPGLARKMSCPHCALHDFLESRHREASEVQGSGSAPSFRALEKPPGTVGLDSEKHMPGSGCFQVNVVQRRCLSTLPVGIPTCPGRWAR